MFGEDDGLVVVYIARGIEQRDARLRLDQIAQLDERRIARQFGAVPLPEPIPALRPMIEPAAQRGGWRDVLQPQIDPRFIFLDPAWP